MAVVVYLDTILVPISLFLTVGYHAFLWRSFKNKPSHTTIGINMLKRRAWFLEIKGGDEDKMGMLAVQSLRNTLMETTLTASITILIVVSLAALVNNAYSATHIFSSAIFGSQSTRIFALKYGSAALALSISFLCSSMAIAFLIDANFLINATGDHEFTSSEHTRSILEKGFVLALISSRMLCITFPVLLWMLGPIPVCLSSMALVWGLYGLDFAGKLANSNKQSLT
ncbi:PREDICTED: uncharacterized protein LOC101304593 [Fragaria vesca subsp. vesca]|uniref:uncharacterized protein LOC101304593 n=1 Tax=Fragaria vesca subsp. vesca TaxID=101020 RepID=UPI0002C2F2AA|nr:PREDICTED: uncharacterized protein LOC101304593 [Fragaria vesca subsp. vesca]